MNRKKFRFGIIYICSFLLIFFTFVVVVINIKDTYSSFDTADGCSEDAVLQLAKIIYKEVGGDSSSIPELNFYRRITTGSIVLNNAINRNGNTWYEKIYNLTDNQYGGYSSYKYLDYDTVTSGASEERKREILYIAQLVLSNKYNVSVNMRLQASLDIVQAYGTVWDYTTSISGYNVYFGYIGELSNVDVFGTTIPDTSSTYFRNLAESLKLDDYSKFTMENICKVDLGNNVKKEYVVKFYSDNKLYHSSTIEENELITLPKQPSKDGYIFKGWALENGDLFDFNNKVSSDLNLYAIWEKNIVTYRVDFYLDNDSDDLYTSIEVEENMKVVLPEIPIRDGYIFKWWSDNLGNKFDESVGITKNINLYAVWEKENVSYKVDFYLNDNDIYTSIEVEEGKFVVVPENPVRDGYEFKGWIDENGKIFDLKTEIIDNIKLYADWRKIDNVSIEDNTKIDNPKTGGFTIFWVIIIGILSICCFWIYYKKVNDNKSF